MRSVSSSSSWGQFAPVQCLESQPRRYVMQARQEQTEKAFPARLINSFFIVLRNWNI